MKKGGYPKIDKKRNNPEVIRVTNFLDGLGVKLKIEASRDDWRKLFEFSSGMIYPTYYEIKDIKNNPRLLEKEIKLIHKKFKKLLYEGVVYNFLWPVANELNGKPSDSKKYIIKYLKIEAALLHGYFDAYKTIKDIPAHIEKIIPDFASKMQAGEIDPIACSAHCMQAVYGEIADYIGLKPFPILEDCNAQDHLETFNVTYIIDGRKLVKTRLELMFFLSGIDYLILSTKQFGHDPDKSTVDFLNVVHARYALDNGLEDPVYKTNPSQLFDINPR